MSKLMVPLGMTKEDCRLIKKFYSFSTAHHRPNRLSIDELTERINYYRNNPVLISLKNFKTGQVLLLREVIYSVVSRRVSTSLLLLSDGAFIDKSDYNWGYRFSANDEYLDESNVGYSLGNIVSEFGNDMVMSDFAFCLITRKDRDNESLLNLASKCIAGISANRSPMMSNADVFMSLISRSYPTFFDNSLLENRIEIDTAFKMPRNYYGGFSREGENKAVFDNLVYEAIIHHINTNFTSDDIKRTECDTLLSDYRLRLPVKDMIVNFVRSGAKEESDKEVLWEFN